MNTEPGFHGRRAGARGFGLILALGVIALLAVAALTAAMNATQGLEAAQLRLCQMQALRCAEAGLSEAITALRADSTFSGFGAVWRALPTNAGTAYRVEVTNNAGGTAAMRAPDGALVPAGAVYLASTGRATRDIRRTVTALALKRQTGLFGYAVFGDRSVVISGGSTVDGWDSSLGPYGLASVVSGGGDVGTNSIDAGALSFSGGARIDGDLTVGPGGDPAIAVRGAEAATGTTRVSSEAQALPIPTPPPGAPSTVANVRVNSGQSRTLTPGTYGDLDMRGGTLTLQTGTYVFTSGRSSSGSVKLKGTLALAPGAGPVRVYFSGAWDSTGGAIVNSTGSAANLVIVGASSVRSVTLVGNSTACYGFWAPTADIRVNGGTDIWGSLVGASLKITGNTGIHFDTGLLRVDDLGGQTNWVLTARHRG